MSERTTEPTVDAEQTDLDAAFMKAALAAAATAEAHGDVPVGAVVVKDGVIIATGENRREADEDPCAHAEVRALTAAAQATGHWRLTGCTLYVTLEPCFMCAGALVNARVDRLVYAATDPKAGAVESLATVCTDPRLNHRVEVVGGVRGEDASAQLKAFFKAKRKQKRAERAAAAEDGDGA